MTSLKIEEFCKLFDGICISSRDRFPQDEEIKYYKAVYPYKTVYKCIIYSMHPEETLNEIINHIDEIRHEIEKIPGTLLIIEVVHNNEKYKIYIEENEDVINVRYRKEEIEEKSATVKHYEKISEKLKELISSKSMIYI